jgi:hypothetical protein
MGMGQNSLKTPPVWAYQGKMTCESLVRGFGGCAATHVAGTGQPVRFFPAILLGRPWVVVTVPTLVLCARW